MENPTTVKLENADGTVVFETVLSNAPEGSDEEQEAVRLLDVIIMMVENIQGEELLGMFSATNKRGVLMAAVRSQMIYDLLVSTDNNFRAKHNIK